MAAITILKPMACLYLLIGIALSIPSFDHGSFDDGSLLPIRGAFMPRAAPFEIRGVQGGRKKRYIVEREEPSACSKECSQRPVCLPTLGEVIKDCKCKRCVSGIPAPDGKSCQENCPEGTFDPRS